MQKYDRRTWNITGIVDGAEPVDVLLNRTNNPLERYNRTLNAAFPNAVPLWQLS